MARTVSVRAGRIQPDAAQVHVAATEPEQHAAATERGRVALELERREDGRQGDLVVLLGADRRERAAWPRRRRRVADAGPR